MKKKFLCAVFHILFFSLKIPAQDTLPEFSLVNTGNNRIIIGWVNNFQDVKQISIQRSADSLTGYKTIITMADPSAIQNGYLDTKAPNERMFYRIYILLDKGMYLFSRAKRPSAYTTTAFVNNNVITILPNDNNSKASGDSVQQSLPLVIRLEGSSVSTDTVAVASPHNAKSPTGFIPSSYVFTCTDGYVCVKLPDEYKLKKYSIKFFKDDLILFELKDLKESEFKLDKANFYHAGWFRFELYEEGKLIENHKFYLEKDF